MTTYRVTEHGLAGDGVTCNAGALSALIEKAGDNSEFVFPAGRYFFNKVVSVSGKKNITFSGEPGAILLTHFGPAGDPKENNNLFFFTHCADIVIRDFTCTTDNPIGWAGVLVAKDPENYTYDARIYDEFAVTGLEHPVALNSCDADGTPDYRMDCGLWRGETTVTVDGREVTRYGGFDYDVIGDHLLRFKVERNEHNRRALENVPIGEQLCYRFIVYGNSIFNFSSCDRGTLKNIEIERASSVGTMIYPRSSDFTFDNFNIRVPRHKSQALYAANADGIHILGLTGFLHMYECHFDGLGDDTLNIHSTAGEIVSIDGDRFGMQERHRNGSFSQLPGNWAQAGDVIEVYDSATFLRKGALTISGFENGVATVTVKEGEYAVGDALANTAYYAATHLRGCDARNTRARGFLLQTRNVIVEDGYVFGMSLPSIIVSPDIKVWFEVGPSENVTIRRNRFEKCAFIKSSANLGAIVVKGCHDQGAEDYPAGVHRNMTIEDNTFVGMGNSGVYVSATDGVTIRNNRFENCSIDRFDNERESTLYDIVTRNCNNVTVAGNTTTKDGARLFYPMQCENVTTDK